MPTSTRKKTGKTRRPVTPEDLTRLITVGDPRISPDGSTIAFTRKHTGDKNNSVTNIWLADTEDDSVRQFTAGERDGHPRWSPDGEHIAFIGTRDKHKPQIYIIDAHGGEAQALTSFPEGSIGGFSWSPDGSRLAVKFREQDPDWTQEAKKHREEHGLSDPPRALDHWWYRLDGDGYFNGQRYHLFLVDINTGEHETVYTKDTLGFFTFDFAPDGRHLAIGTNRDKRAGTRAWNDEILIMDVRSKRLRTVPNLPAGPKDAIKWSPDGKLIAYAGREGGDSTYSVENLDLWVCDPKAGKARCITGKHDYCLMAITLGDSAEAVFGPVFEWSHDSRRLFMQVGWHGETHIAAVKRSGGDVVFLTSGAKQYNMGNLSADGQSLAMQVGSATAPAEINVGLVGTETIAATALTRFNADLLKELQIARPTSHWVRSEDGNKVHVWAMRPANAPKRGRRPAILEIHGGPHAQYGYSFFHEFQVLAAAGYTVFYSNPRGSKGYGRDHTAAISGDWGNKDWVDLQAVIAFMKEQPDVNAKRMGVMGGSYGGYMTNWIIGQTREFAAAISDRCVSNLVSMAGNSDFVDEPDRYFPGNAWDRPEARWKCSPIRFFNKVRTPTLLIHSEGDLRCNVEQSEQVFAALNVRNIPARFVRYPSSTSHGMSRNGPPDLRQHRLNEILDWMSTYLKR